MHNLDLVAVSKAGSSEIIESMHYHGNRYSTIVFKVNKVNLKVRELSLKMYSPICVDPTFLARFLPHIW